MNINEVGFTEGTFFGNYYVWSTPIVVAAAALIAMIAVFMTSDRRPYGTAIRALAILSFLGTMPLGLTRIGIDFNADAEGMAVISMLGVIGAGIVSVFHFLIRGMMSRGSAAPTTTTEPASEEMVEADATVVDAPEEAAEEPAPVEGAETMAEDPRPGEEAAPGQTFDEVPPEANTVGPQPGAATAMVAPPAWLVFKSGANAGQTIPIAGAVTTIGRAPENDVVIEDTSVSRTHAEITFVDGEFQLSDSGSSGGTMVEGRSAATTIPLSSGSAVNIGDTELVFMQGASPVGAAAPETAPPSPTAPSTAAAETMVGEPAEEKQKLMLWLAITGGANKGGTCQVNVGETTIGRAEDSHLHVDDAAVSRNHAMVIAADDGMSIFDLGSASGTTVDGQTLGGRVLSSTSVVAVGDTELMLVDVERAASEVEAPTADAAAATMVEGMSGAGGPAQGGVLVARKGPDGGKTFQLSEGDNVIGREDCAVLLSDPTASRRHAVIRKSGDSYTVFDLGSRSGTIVDGEKLSGAPIKGGSVISVGRSEIVVMDPAAG